MNEEHKRIVVGVDGSSLSLVALRTAHRLADLLGCHIQAVTVWSYPVALAVPIPSTEWTPRVEAESALDETLAAAFGQELPEGLTKTAGPANRSTSWWRPAGVRKCWWWAAGAGEASKGCCSARSAPPQLHMPIARY